MKIKIEDILAKKSQEKIICLTAYTYPIAKILDDFCDIILVGDSLGMAIYGHQDTCDVTAAMMIDHAQAVMRAVKKSLVIVDIPHEIMQKKTMTEIVNLSKEIFDATECDALKIETTRHVVPVIKMLRDLKIPIVSHVGLLPQKSREIGGYKYQGKDRIGAQEILQTALLAENAGAFACVIEAVPAELADKITASLTTPTIGIGASVGCDGQVLVIDDLLGLNQEFKPRFVEHYANLAGEIKVALTNFSQDVKEGKFPAQKNMI